MPVVTSQNSQINHNVHSTNYFFLLYMVTQFAKSTAIAILIVFTKDINFLTYL